MNANSTQSFLKIFQRGSANVRWCEDVLATESNGGKNDHWVAEFYNTLSNAGFVVAGVLGLIRVLSAKEKPMNFKAFVLLESIMVVGVGFGSIMFHAHQSLFSQYSDELPMSLLMLWYNYTLSGLHPLMTHPDYKRKFDYNYSCNCGRSLGFIYPYRPIRCVPRVFHFSNYSLAGTHLRCWTPCESSSWQLVVWNRRLGYW